VAAGTGQDGGIDQIPRVAALARTLGFRVIAVIDRDKDSTQSETQITRIEDACDILRPGGTGTSRARQASAGVW
jgi:tRNA A37 threonylcarbamoyladenosine synthetase subunit TsaC/SUA5/YrdC